MKKFDVIIIGGGPAGSSLGILLSEKGWDVLIIEKAVFPRQKVCGEFLSPAIWPFLHRLQLTHQVVSSSGQFVEGVSFSSSHQKGIESQLVGLQGYPSFGYGISRKVFDHILLSEAQNKGCHVLEHREAKRITKDGDSYFVDTFDNVRHESFSYEASLVVNAGGKSGCQQFFEKKDRSLPEKVGFKAHFAGKRVGNKTKLFFFEGGYLGVVDVEGGKTNLCGIVEEEAFRKNSANFDVLLKRASEQNDEVRSFVNNSSRESKWFACSLAQNYPKGYQRGIFCVGDAACFLEPFMGQGMTMAIAGAFILASLLGNEITKSQDLDILGAHYEELLSHLYRTKLRVGTFFNWFVSSVDKSSLAIDFFSSFPFVLSLVIKKVCTPDSLVTAEKNCLPFDSRGMIKPSVL